QRQTRFAASIFHSSDLPDATRRFAACRLRHQRQLAISLPETSAFAAPKTGAYVPRCRNRDTPCRGIFRSSCEAYGIGKVALSFHRPSLLPSVAGLADNGNHMSQPCPCSARIL